MNKIFVVCSVLIFCVNAGFAGCIQATFYDKKYYCCIDKGELPSGTPDNNVVMLKDGEWAPINPNMAHVMKCSSRSKIGDTEYGSFGAFESKISDNTADKFYRGQNLKYADSTQSYTMYYKDFATRLGWYSIMARSDNKVPGRVNRGGASDGTTYFRYGVCEKAADVDKMCIYMQAVKNGITSCWSHWSNDYIKGAGESLHTGDVILVATSFGDYYCSSDNSVGKWTPLKFCYNNRIKHGELVNKAYAILNKSEFEKKYIKSESDGEICLIEKDEEDESGYTEEETAAEESSELGADAATEESSSEEEPEESSSETESVIQYGYQQCSSNSDCTREKLSAYLNGNPYLHSTDWYCIEQTSGNHVCAAKACEDEYEIKTINGNPQGYCIKKTASVATAGQTPPAGQQQKQSYGNSDKPTVTSEQKQQSSDAERIKQLTA
ncbi:MAG: hypothetical protein IJR92_02420, partial [Alphaproteobacteria bacterium]|nr:hypothetical protein [Alphaproteobacteria bacterium]